MQRIERRIESLEAQHGDEAEPNIIVVKYIRPGDMACTKEVRLNLTTGETVETTFIQDDVD